ncbi:ERCC4 domain-containing protein [Cumulibacter manganitolerans]|uniref:ERCC4 domain-containing protein n=1 Tax=Cumulibacter manganitolerans TaxID=1884992 RepID=UPI001294ED72|nr:ERCC4 domain-containing protein [Cumulibacter manganitolerans]
MTEPLLIVRNPDAASSLPYLVRIPIGDGIVLRTRETWPRTSKVYCHRHDGPWPDDAEIVESVPLRECSRRGAAIDIVADRRREARSQFVLTRARGREMIFWQTARVAKAARPNVALPKARAGGLDSLEIVVDTRERYAWKFAQQQATVTKRALPVGDYATFVDDDLVAVVERKSLDDLVGSLTSGRLAYRLADLTGIDRAAVVVEDRYSAVFKLEHVRPAVVAEMLAECQVRWPSVPILFLENRSLAQEWSYRFLGSAVRERLVGEEAHRILPDSE